TSRGHNRKGSSFAQLLRRHPVAMFGLPFCLLMVGGSFALAEFTQTRYDLRARTASKLDNEAKLRLESDRRQLSLQEEYWASEG
ncbi:cytochrome c oxidase assembly protein COX16-domain-containing protein, partial [Thamnocephalis sphaerospora]